MIDKSNQYGGSGYRGNQYSSSSKFGNKRTLSAINMLRKLCNHKYLVSSPSNEILWKQEWSYSNSRNVNKKKKLNSSSSSSSNHPIQGNFSIEERKSYQEEKYQNEISRLQPDLVAPIEIKEYDLSLEGMLEGGGKLIVLLKILTSWRSNESRDEENNKEEEEEEAENEVEIPNKVLVFTHSLVMLDLIEEMVSIMGWSYLRMDGHTNVTTRQKLVDSFNSDPSIFLFILTTKTGGLGLHLTSANKVILVDPDWNPQNDIQARERVWRLGQSRPVTVYRLITKGTIEEKIYQRQIFKTIISQGILSTSSSPSHQKLFSSHSLHDLFSFTGGEDNVGCDLEESVPEGVIMTESDDLLKSTSNKKTDKVEEGIEEVVEVEESQKDLLDALFDGKDIAAVFSHDYIEENDQEEEEEGSGKKRKRSNQYSFLRSTSDTEIKRMSDHALRSLRQDRKERNKVIRFGSGKKNTSSSSSSSLLSHLREISTSSSSSSSLADPTSHITIMKQLESFLKNNNDHGVSSKQLLDHFPTLPNSYAPLFRQMLQSVADFDSTKRLWKIKSEY